MTIQLGVVKSPKDHCSLPFSLGEYNIVMLNPTAGGWAELYLPHQFFQPSFEDYSRKIDLLSVQLKAHTPQGLVNHGAAMHMKIVSEVFVSGLRLVVSWC